MRLERTKDRGCRRRKNPTGPARSSSEFKRRQSLAAEVGSSHGLLPLTRSFYSPRDGQDTASSTTECNLLLLASEKVENIYLMGFLSTSLVIQTLESIRADPLCHRFRVASSFVRINRRV